MFPRDMVCLRNIGVDTLHKGDTEDDDNNNNNKILVINIFLVVSYCDNTVGVLPFKCPTFTTFTYANVHKQNTP
jgi:hypothetical protein